jgi:hypothetical protein
MDFWDQSSRRPGDKKATNAVSLPLGFGGLFRPVFERVVTQILHNLRVVWDCRIHLIAFPTAQRDRANPQSASRFRLVDFQMEAPPPEVAANGGRFLWDLNATVV